MQDYQLYLFQNFVYEPFSGYGSTQKYFSCFLPFKGVRNPRCSGNLHGEFIPNTSLPPSYRCHIGNKEAFSHQAKKIKLGQESQTKLISLGTWRLVVVVRLKWSTLFRGLKSPRNRHIRHIRVKSMRSFITKQYLHQDAFFSASIVFNFQTISLILTLKVAKLSAIYVQNFKNYIETRGESPQVTVEHLILLNC